MHRDLAHPLPLLAVALLLLNDHALKGSGLLPGWLTGKLSDFAGLFFFPILLCSAALWVAPAARRPGARRAVMLLATTATAVVFSALKLSPSLNAFASRHWGPIVLDPTDLLALPALGASLLYLESRSSAGPAPRWFQALSVVVASAASIATPAPRYNRAYPAWEMTRETDLRLGCARLQPFIARSGKQGIGVAVEVRGGDARGSEGCPVSASARLLLGGRVIEPAVPPQTLSTDWEIRYLYIPIPFDNEASWNSGERLAELELQLQAGGEQRSLRVPLVHRFDSYYEERSWTIPSASSEAARPPPVPPGTDIPILPPPSRGTYR